VYLYLQVRRSGAYESVSLEQLTEQLRLPELPIYIYIHSSISVYVCIYYIYLSVYLCLQVRRSGAYANVSFEQLTAELPLPELPIYLCIEFTHIYLYVYLSIFIYAYISIYVCMYLYLQVRRSGAYESVSLEQLTA